MDLRAERAFTEHAKDLNAYNKLPHAAQFVCWTRASYAFTRPWARRYGAMTVPVSTQIRRSNSSAVGKYLMRRLGLILLFLLTSELVIASDEQLFVDKLMSTMYTEDNSVYKTLLHPAMDKCANRMWNQKKGRAPTATEYEYTITQASQRAMNNEKATAGIAGVENPSFIIEPTHELVVTYESQNEFPQGHPCHSERSITFHTLLVKDSGNLSITAACVSQEAAKAIAERQAKGLEEKGERAKKGQEIFDNLSIEKQKRYERLLSENVVTALKTYSDELDIDLTTANAFRDKLCSEFQ